MGGWAKVDGVERAWFCSGAGWSCRKVLMTGDAAFFLDLSPRKYAHCPDCALKYLGERPPEEMPAVSDAGEGTRARGTVTALTAGLMLAAGDVFVCFIGQKVIEFVVCQFQVPHPRTGGADWPFDLQAVMPGVVGNIPAGKFLIRRGSRLEVQAITNFTGGTDPQPAEVAAPIKSAPSVVAALATLDQSPSHEERVARALFETDPRVIAIATKASECEAYRAAGKNEMAADRYRDAMIAAWGGDWTKSPPREPALRKEAEARAALIMPRLRGR